MIKAATLFAFLAVLALSSQAQAAHHGDTPHTATTQQNKMKTCAAEYHKKGIAKSQYRAFMKECLKKHPGKTDKK